MEKRDNGFKIIAVIALVIAVAGLSIAYASFTANLTIDGTATVSSNWNIKWTSLTSNDTGYATAGDLTIGTGAQTINGTIGNLVAPGDSITWSWKVENQGNINAELTGLTLTDISCSPVTGGSSEATDEEAAALCDDLSLQFDYDSDDNISALSSVTDKSLAANGAKDVVMTLTYDLSSDATISGPVAVSLTATPTFTYSQANAS